MKLDSTSQIDLALSRVGDQLAFEREYFAIVVLGGAALNLLGIVTRATSDVDVLAFATAIPGTRERALHAPPEPMPAALERAALAVARDMALDPSWLNTVAALQWSQGLPSGIASRLAWRHYGPDDMREVGLDVGLVSRVDLIFFKLYATADHSSTTSVHYRDLLALAPTIEELTAAAEWVRPQNASPEFHMILDDVVAHIRRQIHPDGE